MERMSEEELKKELKKLKDFKVYAFEGDVYVKAEDYKEIAIENKNLKKERDLYKARNEELNEDCFGLAKENKKLKDRIDVLYEFIERNDKLVDEVIAEEDLDKLNRYIYIDDDLVDRTLESED